MSLWLVELRMLIVSAALLGCLGPTVAQSFPQPPCEGARSLPEFADPGGTPNYHVWSESDLGERWTPPACTGWIPKEGTLVAVAGRFHYSGDVDGLLSRFGAISKLVGIQYWSIRENGWRTLITSASALDGPDANQPRADFSINEMKSGTDLYFTETDNRTAQPVIYRMHVKVRPGNLAIAIENVSPVRQFLFTLLRPGDMQSVHLFARAAPNIWTYYGLARTGVSTSFLEVKQESYVNRALALYSHFTGTLPAPFRQPERNR